MKVNNVANYKERSPAAFIADISHHQSDKDFIKLLQVNPKGLIHKIGQDGNFDSAVLRRVSGKVVTLPDSLQYIGGYFYVKNTGIKRGMKEIEAINAGRVYLTKIKKTLDSFLNVTKKPAGLVALDIERNDPHTTDFVKDLEAGRLDRNQKLAIRDMLVNWRELCKLRGIKPVVYSGLHVMRQLITANLIPDGFYLWVASWPGPKDTKAEAPALPIAEKPGLRALLWQCSAPSGNVSNKDGVKRNVTTKNVTVNGVICDFNLPYYL